MTEQPDHPDRERDGKNEKHDATLAPCFAERTARPRLSSIVTVTLVLKRSGNVEAASPFTCAHEQFLALPPLHLFGHARRIGDHLLELFNLIAQLRFLPGQFRFAMIERGTRFTRAAKHAASLDPMGHPEKEKKRDESKNDKRQTECEPDFDPASEIPSFVQQIGYVRRGFGQRLVAASSSGRLQPAALLTEVPARALHRA